MAKRIFDVLAAGSALIVLSPLFLLLALSVGLSSRGGVFYRQTRIGRHGKPFQLLKFRSMYARSDQQGLLTVGADKRITPVGRFLRRYKLDELPQLWNILRGDMSIVGPRPEVPRYVQHYSPEQRKVLSVRPGLTDYASLHYIDEAAVLAQSDNPEKTYLEEILPHKLELGLQYVEKQSLPEDLKIIFQTLRKLVK
ncbi:MAG TPA: sugar transferase [Phaeodactylibacter sp.]|nr:sugar transferase [Phaeodactylibacter sp.]